MFVCLLACFEVGQVFLVGFFFHFCYHFDFRVLCFYFRSHFAWFPWSSYSKKKGTWCRLRQTKEKRR